MKRVLSCSFIFLCAWSFLSPDAGAIPAFARKYGFNCNMCHSGFTRLNDFGQRFRDNGYQVPGQAGGEKTVFDQGPPLALRTSAGLSMSSADNKTSGGFNIFGLDLLAAGLFHKDVSFLLIYTPRIDEPAADFNGPDAGNNPSQFGSLESASIIFSNIVPNVLNLRIGKFEPAYHPFSSKRKHFLFQPYEVYAFSTPTSNFVFDDNQMGIEASGRLADKFKYGAGIVNGTGANPDNNTAKDFYLNTSYTIGKGDGQTTGQRLGVLAYYGWQPADTSALVAGPTGETNGGNNKSFYRFGVDGSFNYENFNLGLLYLMGQDDKGLNVINPASSYEFTGGFAELNWTGMMNDRLSVSFLYNWVRPPSYDAERKVDAYTGLMRYYLGDWSAVNVALHAEYTFRQIGDLNKLDEHLAALVVDFGF